MVLRPCVQLNTGEYNLRLQTAPAKLYNKSTDISRKRWSEQMDMENLIGETTEYDKKAALEVKKPKSWCKSYNKRPEMDSLFGIQCTCTCHLLRARLATAEEVTARRNLAFTPLRLPWQPRILRLQYQNRWHRNAENHYHQAYTEGFAVFIFVSSRQTHGKYRSLIILLPSS